MSEQPLIRRIIDAQPHWQRSEGRCRQLWLRLPDPTSAIIMDTLYFIAILLLGAVGAELVSILEVLAEVALFGIPSATPLHGAREGFS